MKNPCAKCHPPKRHPGCHGHCDDEAAFLEIDLAERIEFCKRRAGME